MLNYLEFQGDATSTTSSITVYLKTVLEITVKTISIYLGPTSEGSTVNVTIKDYDGDLDSLSISSSSYYTFNINKKYNANQNIAFIIVSDNIINCIYGYSTDEIGTLGLIFRAGQNLPSIKIGVESEIDFLWNINKLISEGYPYFTESINLKNTIENLDLFVDSGDLTSIFGQYGYTQNQWLEYYKGYVYKIEPSLWEGYPFVWIPPKIEEYVIEGLMVYVGEANNNYSQRLVFVNKAQQAVYMKRKED